MQSHDTLSDSDTGENQYIPAQFADSTYICSGDERDADSLDEETDNDWIDEDMKSTTTSQTLPSRCSSSSSIKKLTFKEIEGKSAGKAIYANILEQESKDEHYYPFVSDLDYAYALYLHNTKQSKGSVKEFFDDPRLKPIHDQLSFKNADQWDAKLHAISHGIKEDTWQTVWIEIQDTIDARRLHRFIVRHRQVLPVIRFLIGFPPFQDHLTYAPVQLMNANEERVYNEMHTGDWWWEKQRELPEGATIIPLLLASDKTMLSQHHGDVSAWPVYLTIGNLDNETRRKQDVPGSILFGIIPVGTGNAKAEVYHRSLKTMLERRVSFNNLPAAESNAYMRIALEEASQIGLEIECADGQTRLCFPIIAGFMADYEEQTIITGIASTTCPICTVPPRHRQDLCQWPQWPPRTHEYTQKLIARQRDAGLPKATQTSRQESNTINIKRRDLWIDWVHDVENFAWSHPYVNIHAAMMVDILHQLLKGVFMHLHQWVQALLKSRKGKQVLKGVERGVAHIGGLGHLDRRFEMIPPYTGLKVFKKISQVKQWTGVEQKAMIKQYVAVLAPLLMAEHTGELYCIRAIIDFITLAQYRSHSEETLRYMLAALKRIDLLKDVFAPYRPVDKITEAGHFNFPKFHAMTHYPEYIRLYGAADGVDTSHGEAAHKYQIKEYYGRTNKRDTYLDQLVLLNIRRVKVISMEAILAHRLLEKVRKSPSEKLILSHNTRPSKAVPLAKLGIKLSATEALEVKMHRLEKGLWCRASALADHLHIDGFLEALATFVIQNRARQNGIPLTDEDLDRRQKVTFNIQDYFTCFHRSLTCWKPNGKVSNDLDKLIPEKVRCSPAWMGGGGRNDYAWVQEYQVNDHEDQSQSILNGRLVGQVMMTITVCDPQSFDPQTNRARRYTGALIEVLRPINNGIPHEVHGMIELQKWTVHKARNARKLGGLRFYSMSTILRSAHVVPADKAGVFYINNYIDWDQYNSVYDPDFLVSDYRVAEKFAKAYAITRKKAAAIKNTA